MNNNKQLLQTVLEYLKLTGWKTPTKKDMDLLINCRRNAYSKGYEPTYKSYEPMFSTKFYNELSGTYCYTLSLLNDMDPLEFHVLNHVTGSTIIFNQYAFEDAMSEYNWLIDCGIDARFSMLSRLNVYEVTIAYKYKQYGGK